MDHHWITEQNQRDFCPYCRTKMNGDRWKSEWHLDTHYKTIDCKCCERKIWITVDFESDGNDSWDGNPVLVVKDSLEYKLTESKNIV